MKGRVLSMKSDFLKLQTHLLFSPQEPEFNFLWGNQVWCEESR